MNSVLAEKNRQIDELQRQLTRNMSHNRLESMRRSGGSNKNKRTL